MKKRILAILLVVVFVFGMTACGEKAPVTEPDETPDDPNAGQLIVAVNSDFVTFDPGRGYEAVASMIFNAVYDNLVKFNETVEHVDPCIATEWTIADDKVTYTFTLREGVKFSSGNDLTSKDVKWSFDRVKNIMSNATAITEVIESVEVNGDYEVIIKLKQPDPAFLAKLATSSFSVVDSVTAEANGAVAGTDAATADTAELWFNSNSAGSGPYMIESWTPSTELVLVANPNYWEGTPNFEKILIKEVADANTQKMMLEGGEIDIAFYLTPEHCAELESNADVKVLRSPTMTITNLIFNNDPEVGGPFADKRVQKAVRLALDYDGLQVIAGEGSVTPQSIIQVGFLGSGPQRNNANTRDIDAAKALLAEAGYADGFDFILNCADYFSESVPWSLFAQKIQSDLKEIGINLEIRPTELMVGLDEYRNGKQGLGVWNWSADYPDGLNQLAFLPGGKVGTDRLRWTKEQSPEIYELGEKIKVEVDDAERAKLMQELQNMLDEDSPFCTFVQSARSFAVRSNIEGAQYIEAYRMELENITKN